MPLRSRKRALALRAASRASAASTALAIMSLAVLGCSSRYLARKSPTTELTTPSSSGLLSLTLVCDSNCGFGIRTEMIAVRPSRRSSPVGTMSLKMFSFLP